MFRTGQMCIQSRKTSMSNKNLITGYYPYKNPLSRETSRPIPTSAMTNVRFEDCTLKLKSFVRVESNSRISDLRACIIEKLQNICNETKQVVNADKLYLATKRGCRYHLKDPLNKVHQNPEIIQVLYDQPDETESIGKNQTVVEDCLDTIREKPRYSSSSSSPRYSPSSAVRRESDSEIGIKRPMPSYDRVSIVTKEAKLTQWRYR